MMQIQTHFEQYHGITASKLAYALKLMDEGNQSGARALIAEVQQTNEEQAAVTDTRIYDAVRRLCSHRQMDSRRFYAMQQALGLREIVRSLLVGSCPDLIAQHTPIENDFFAHMLGAFPKDEAGGIRGDSAYSTRGEYRNGNARLWELFCAAQDAKAEQDKPEVQA